MLQRSSKKKRKNRPSDKNQFAKSIVDEATGRTRPEEPTAPKKNPAAVALGKLGGEKGGPARAKKLSKKRRREIARKAAQARWEKKKQQMS